MFLAAFHPRTVPVTSHEISVSFHAVESRKTSASVSSNTSKNDMRNLFVFPVCDAWGSVPNETLEVKL